MKKRTVLCFFAVALVLGCTAKMYNQTKTQYVNQTFSSEVLYSGGIALLPVTAGEGQEGFRRPLGQCLNEYLPQALPGAKILTWETSMDSLNRNALVDEYQQLIESYQRTSILDREKVKEMASALGVRFALFSSLVDFSETSPTGSGNVTAQCLILDLETGDIMQEIHGQATSVVIGQHHEFPYEEYTDMIARSVLMQLPGSKLEKPVPPKPKSSSMRNY